MFEVTVKQVSTRQIPICKVNNSNQVRRNRGEAEEATAPSQIFDKVDLLPIDNDREQKKKIKKTKTI